MLLCFSDIVYVRFDFRILYYCILTFMTVDFLVLFDVLFLFTFFLRWFLYIWCYKYSSIVVVSFVLSGTCKHAQQLVLICPLVWVED